MSKTIDESKLFDRWEQSNAIQSLIIFFGFLIIFPLAHSILEDKNFSIGLIVLSIIGLSISIFIKIKLELKWDKEKDL